MAIWLSRNGDYLFLDCQKMFPFMQIKHLDSDFLFLSLFSKRNMKMSTYFFILGRGSKSTNTVDNKTYFPGCLGGLVS